MTDPERFVRLSAVLLDLPRVRLYGTGMVERYAQETRARAGDRATDGMLAAFEALPPHTDPCWEARLRSDVLQHACFGPVARNVMRMWLTGTWNGLGPVWHERFGGDPQEVTSVVSAAAYREALVWPIIGTHPQSAKQPGFGTWAMDPPPFAEVTS